METLATFAVFSLTIVAVVALGRPIQARWGKNGVEITTQHDRKNKRRAQKIR